jgi:hypothetical protein
MTSPLKILANRANALKEHGPEDSGRQGACVT